MNGASQNRSSGHPDLNQKLGNIGKLGGTRTAQSARAASQQSNTASSVVVSVPDDALIERYRKVVVINIQPKQWCLQRGKGTFYYQDKTLLTHHLRDMLMHTHSLASRAPEIPIIDRISMDLDCKEKVNLARRTDAYFRLRQVFGPERRPLVYGTPSGSGLRVVYRIPETPLHDIITGPKIGLIADVLRAADLSPREGFIEIFPQRLQPERLPLGRRMPILDPDTLKPLRHANIGDTYCLRMLLGGLEEMERWHAHPDPDLLEHLRSLPQRPLDTDGAEGGARVHLVFDPAARKAVPKPALEALVANGLPGPGSRFAAEWQVGLAFVSDPAQYANYGLTVHSTEEDIARAIARWLSVRHNGRSKEWELSARRQGSGGGAIQEWTERYLTPSPAGDHMITRLKRAVMALDPTTDRIIQLNARERAWLLQVAKKHYPAGALRYRFEVWLFCWLRAVKSCLLYSSTRDGTVIPMRRGTHVRVQMSALWMQAWPYGKGRNGETGKTRYVEYRHILESRGIMTWAEGYVNPRLWHSQLEEHYRGIATRYSVKVPDLNTTTEDVPVAPWILRAAIDQISGPHKRRLTLDEAYHALEVTAGGTDLTKRYSAHVGKEITRLAEAIRAALDGGVQHAATPSAPAGETDAPFPLAA